MDEDVGAGVIAPSSANMTVTACPALCTQLHRSGRKVPRRGRRNPAT
jgi:hypothetical protein